MNARRDGAAGQDGASDASPQARQAGRGRATDGAQQQQQWDVPTLGRRPTGALGKAPRYPERGGPAGVPHLPSREAPPARARIPHVPGPPPHGAKPSGRAGQGQASPAPAGRRLRDSREPAVSAGTAGAGRGRRCDCWGRAGTGQGTGTGRDGSDPPGWCGHVFSRPAPNTEKGVVLPKAG